MREQLIQYVNLLFAGAADSEDIKQEILQNTLDRYDDLISQGKAPEAAYRLAISGIGDINEILEQKPGRPVFQQPSPTMDSPVQQEDTPEKKKKRAAAIAFYICSPIPLFILSEFGQATMGLCFTLLLVAAATALLIMNRNPQSDESKPITESEPRQELKKSIANLINIIAIVVYLPVSFLSGAWFITWIIFPIASCVRGLINAIIDLKEVSDHEA